MRDEIRRFLALIAAVALLAPAGWAQNPQQAAPPPPAPLAPQVSPNEKGTIRATVNLVEVDVEVTDRNGKPIKGLRQDQFSVAENGKDQKISTFDYYDVERIEKAAAEDVAPITISIGAVSQPEQVRQQIRDRRLIVLFFDLTSLQPNDLTRSTKAAKKFLREQMTPADLVGVVAFGNQLKVVADFTNDRDLLNRPSTRCFPARSRSSRRWPRPPPPELTPRQPKTQTRPSPPTIPSSTSSIPTASWSPSSRWPICCATSPAKNR